MNISCLNVYPERLKYLRTFNFYLHLSENTCTPANVLYYWFGREERDALASKHDIVDCMKAIYQIYDLSII